MTLWIWCFVGAVASLAADDPVLGALVTELDRSMAGHSGDDAPYHLSYRVADQAKWRLTARYGALAQSEESRRRTLDVAVRVGSLDLDSSHPLKGGYVSGLNYHTGHSLPLDGEPKALRAVIWEATNKEVRDARERWSRVQTNQLVKVDDRDPSPDFTAAEAVVDLRDLAAIDVERGRWESVLTEVSLRLDADPDIHGSNASLDGVAETQWIVTSEGTRIRQAREWIRISMSGWTRAEDGMNVRLYRWKDVRDPQSLPAEQTLQTWADELAQELVDLRDAEVGDAYDGPVLLRGKAAGVFVHEVLGHRVEGHRQKDDDEGQTFKDKVGSQLLPTHIDIYDDPTLATAAGEDLNGHYAYDQEGTPAEAGCAGQGRGVHGVLDEPLAYRGLSREQRPWTCCGVAAAGGADGQHGR